jgi:hypothetical protein
MSDHLPFPDPFQAAAEHSAAAEPDGPVLGHRDLTREPSPAAAIDTNTGESTGGLTEPPRLDGDLRAAGRGADGQRQPVRHLAG